MSKRQILSLIGVWIIIFLFLGIPPLWKEILAVISGLGIIAIAYTLPQPEKKEPETHSGAQDTFVENK